MANRRARLVTRHPREAGIHSRDVGIATLRVWIPAFAGMTMIGVETRPMHAYRTHTCAALRAERRRADRPPVGLGAPPARPWRRAVRRSARPLRSGPDRRRRRTATRFKLLETRARRERRHDRRHRRGARRRRQEPQPRHRRDRGARAGRDGAVRRRRAADAGRGRGRNTRRISASNTAISICAASASTRTSCCART